MPRKWGAGLLPDSHSEFVLLVHRPDRQRELLATVGRGRNTPAYFHAVARDSLGRTVKLSDVLEELGYRQGDEIEIERVDGASTLAIGPNPAPHPVEAPGIETDPLFKPSLRHRVMPRWSLEEAGALLSEYNRGSYRGRSNTEIDREAYALFAAGLPEPGPRLVAMLRHVGEYYGGAFRPDGSYAELAERLAEGFHGRTGALGSTLKSLRPLDEAIPDVTVVEDLLQPFRGEKYSFVWGAKFLHFLRPDVFPIIDSVIERALGLHQRIANSSGYLVSFMDVYREVMQENRGVLERMMQEDAERSPTALKVLDKLLWVVGSHLKKHEKRRARRLPRQVG